MAAWTEVDGEEQLLLHAADNSEPPRQVGNMPHGWHFGPAWSPDGKRIAWGDQNYQIHVTDVAGGQSVLVDHGQWEISHYAWSPDSRYLAYEVTLSNLFTQVRLWDGQSGKSYEATEPAFNSSCPAWDPKGKYLYFLSDRYINPFLDRFEARFIVNDATLPCVLALQADAPCPLPPGAIPTWKSQRTKRTRKTPLRRTKPKKKKRWSQSALISTA